jgi:hypothetical protein
MLLIIPFKYSELALYYIQCNSVQNYSCTHTYTVGCFQRTCLFLCLRVILCKSYILS